MDTTFCLVHGAWHGGWCFAPLARELEARGHEVAAPDLPYEDPEGTLTRFAEVVGPRPRAVVVAHSFGGLVLPLVEARAHVYLCAFVPEPGVPPAEAFREGLNPGFGGTERDELGRSYWPSLDVAAERLYAGHEQRWAEWAFPRLRPQSQKAATEPHPLTAFPATPTASIVARGDPCIRPDWSRARARDLLGVEPLEIDGGHFPMFDRSAELADLLERVLEDLP